MRRNRLALLSSKRKVHGYCLFDLCGLACAKAGDKPGMRVF